MELLLPMEDTTEDLYNRQLADPVAIATHAELADRKVWLGDVDSDLINQITRWFLIWAKEDKGKPVEERKPIRVYIYSYGGDLDMTMQIIDLMQCSKTPVYTYAMGCACSAGAFIFLGGEKRFILPRCNLLFHQGSGGSEGTFDQVQSQNAHYKLRIKLLQDFCLERMDIQKQAFSKKWKSEWYLSSEEALKYGVATDIISDLDSIV